MLQNKKSFRAIKRKKAISKRKVLHQTGFAFLRFIVNVFSLQLLHAKRVTYKMAWEFSCYFLP